MAGDGNPNTSKEMKKSYKSKTILFNAAVAAVAVVAPEALAVVPVEWQPLALALANIGLRFITSKGVEFSFGK